MLNFKYFQKLYWVYFFCYFDSNHFPVFHRFKRVGSRKSDDVLWPNSIQDCSNEDMLKMYEPWANYSDTGTFLPYERNSVLK